MPVLKPVHKSSTNQSYLQRSQNPCNFEKVYYLVFKNCDTKFLLLYDCRTYRSIFCLFDENKTKVLNLKVNYKELTLVFVHHVNTECT